MRNVTVLPFENLSDYQNASDIVADMFSTALYSTQRFSVMERAESARRLKLAKVELPEVIDRATALKIGRALHQEGVFYGTITEYGYLFYPDDAVVGLRIHLLDVQSGQIVWTGIFNDQNRGLLQGNDEPISGLAQAGTLQLVRQIVPPPPEN